MYMPPKSDVFSSPIQRKSRYAWTSVSSGWVHPKIAFLSILTFVACTINAQTYDVGPATSGNHQAQTSQSQPQNQQLGWGSNIENVRLARAAQLALQQGNNVLALDYAQRAAQAAPNDAQLRFLLGYAARLNGNYTLSVDAYKRGLTLSPLAIEGLSGLAQTYSLTGRTDDAESLLKQILVSNPKRADDALLLGDLYMRSADYIDALQWLSGAERVQPSARTELLMAICYQHLKQSDMANKYLESARRRAPDNPEVQRAMAGYYRDLGNYPEAIASLNSIRKPKPDVLAELAYTLQLDGRLADSARSI